MPRDRQPTTEDYLRLEQIAQHLRVRSRYPDPRFRADVRAAVLDRVAPIARSLGPCSGEDLADGLAEHLGVKFEEVRGPRDVIALENHYFHGKKELGFARLRTELADPQVDALLFQRMQAREHDSDRWIAVLNLQESEARAYWNRFHELSHRLAEPPQGILPFKRHRLEANPVESLVDAVAADLAFYPPAFEPIISRVVRAGDPLDFGVIDNIQARYAPTASLQCTMNAVVQHWTRPAWVIIAEWRGRVGAPNSDQALRISVKSSSPATDSSRVLFFQNMRVPRGSPIDQTFHTKLDCTQVEHLGNWSTSQGNRLPGIKVLTSARRIGRHVYALVSA